MIASLTIENFKSFLESTTVDFAAGPALKLPGNLLRLRNRERYVKSMALYGPNASGKTTILDALYALRTFVLFSNQDQKPTAPVPEFEPFLLEWAASRRPARIALAVDLGDERYTLDVSATADRVWNESLSVSCTTRQPTRKAVVKNLIKRTWRQRTKDYFTEIDGALGAESTRSAAKEQTPPNRLILGKLASMNSEIAGRIVRWFDDDLWFYDMHRNPDAEDKALSKAARLLKEDLKFAETFGRFMRDADTGVGELRVVDEKAYELAYSVSDKKIEPKEVVRPGLSFRHVTSDGSSVFFSRRRESSGTLRFAALLSVILEPCDRRRLICVDELSASLHPDLVRRILRIVHSSEYNPRGHQLLFTTHDTHLIDPIDTLRRDQVILCSKDRFGRSTFRRLDEYQDAARSDANLQKQYMEGRFGGLPLFGPSLEDVPLDDAALEIAP